MWPSAVLNDDEECLRSCFELVTPAACADRALGSCVATAQAPKSEHAAPCCGLSESQAGLFGTPTTSAFASEHRHKVCVDLS